MAFIGKFNVLRVLRQAPPGLYLDGGTLGEILLPKRQVPRGAVPGSDLEVFLYTDSEDRPIATTEMPLAQVDEFACLRVVSFNPRIGAFLDMGLSKDLLLPLREQKGHVAPGSKILVRLLLDERSDRIIASMRLQRHLNLTPPLYREDEPVNLIVVDETPLGYNTIVEQSHLGLLYHSDLNARLELGQKLKGLVRTVRPDGKIDLKLDASGYDRIGPLSEKILQALTGNQGRLELDDQSPPEAIRGAFGVSKKAFKQAVGALFREQRIRFARGGIELAEVP